MGINCWSTLQNKKNKTRRFSIYNAKYIRIKEKIINKQKKFATFSDKPKHTSKK